MKIDYVARKTTLNDQTRRLIEKKLARIKKYFNDILDMRVEIDQERHLYLVDLLVRGKDFNLKSTSQDKEMTTAIQEAIEKLEIQARRAKARLKSHKPRSREATAEVVPAGSEPEQVTTVHPRVVEVTRIPIKPMSIEEAVLQFEEASAEFFVYRDSSTDTVNVLYRLPDRNLGLITPEQ